MIEKEDLVEVSKLSCVYSDKPDDIFVCCSSFEERCLGSLYRFDGYRANQTYLFSYSSKSKKRDKNLQEMKALLSKISSVTEILTEEDNPIPAVRNLVSNISVFMKDCANPAITLDISTFTKRHLLLLLRALHQIHLLNHTRLLYTEPKKYVIDLVQPLSFGLKEISVIPTFSGQCDPHKDLLLVIFLGYEGDRAMALFENMDPHRCITVIPKPAYRPEWEGTTEKMNSTILNALDKKSIKYADSRNPVRVTEHLRNILSEYPRDKYNYYIAPLGTKPQTVGIFLYTILHPDETTLIYAAPLRHNEPFYSTGIGPTWILPFKKVEESIERF